MARARRNVRARGPRGCTRSRGGVASCPGLLVLSLLPRGAEALFFRAGAGHAGNGSLSASPSTPPCAVYLFQGANYSGWRRRFGEGVYSGEALLRAGVPAGSVGSLHVEGPCAAVLYPQADLSGAFFAYTEGFHDLAGRHAGAPGNSTRALRVLREPPEALGDVPTPLLVHVTHSTPALTGRLGGLWEENLEKLPNGTRLLYYNDEEMAASARNISRALSAAGVVHGAFDAFLSLRPMAYRADLWRYMVLWQYGGVYMDHKVILVSNVAEFIDFSAPGAMWLVKDLELRSGLWNAIMAAPPRHPLMVRVLRHVVGVVQAREYPEYRYPLLAITGPAALSEALGLRGSGAWGNWVIHGFDNLTTQAPRIFAEYLPRRGIVQLGNASHVFSWTDEALHNARASTWYPVFYNRHQVYCDEPGPPCPPV